MLVWTRKTEGFSNKNMMPRTMNATTAVKIVAVMLVLFIFETTVALSVAGPAAISVSNKPSIEHDNDNDDSKLIEVERAMIELHVAEIDGGKDAFSQKYQSGDDDRTRVSDNTESSLSSWGDDDFIDRHLGEKNAGMDANFLPKNGNTIFESLSPVLSEEECSFILEEARETIAQGLIEENSGNENEPTEKRRANSISNSQLGEARLSNMPKTREWLKEALKTRFYPLLKDRFGVDDLVLYDGLVLGNLAPTRSQPIHRDASLLTLNVALSAPGDYEGGGTYIEALDETLQIDRGHLLCHAGSAMHAGNAISRGERWVLVLFLLGEHQPQLARRCHAKAIEHMRLNDFDQAETVLQTGLKSIAPYHDHLLQNTLGRLHLVKGDDPSKAFESFRLADEAYPICQNALVSMAQMLIDKRRPRAALRRLDRVLQRIGDRDLDPSNPVQLSLRSLAYGARRDAARCALICADHLFRTNEARGNKVSAENPSPVLSSSWSSWILQHLPIAIDRLKTCLSAAPNEPTLLGMLDRVEFLYSEAQQDHRG
jgi:tetratricopeptide (TPR) repeat protein